MSFMHRVMLHGAALALPALLAGQGLRLYASPERDGVPASWQTNGAAAPRARGEPRDSACNATSALPRSRTSRAAAALVARSGPSKQE